MHVAVYLPLLAAVALGRLAPRVGRLLPPVTATRLLVAAGAVTATATSFVLAVLAFTLIALLPPVAALGSWSAAELDAATPVPDLAAALAAAAVCAIAAVAVPVLARRAWACVAARRLCAELGGGPGDLLVVDDPDIDVFAVPARRGRIIASRPLLASLPADERRAVLAHETAHLRHHHSRYRLAADVAAAVNPLLRPLATAVRYATERWADEAAARSVGDRAVVARALARTGLRAGHQQRAAAWTAAAMHAAARRSPLVARVQALLAPAPRRRPELVAAVAALLLLTVAASVEAQHDTERLFESVAAAHARGDHRL